MTDTERREAARQFYNKWQNRGREDEDDRSFWIDLLQNVMGVDHVTDRIEFQKKVVGPDGNTKRIDAYIPETKVLIEQKSIGIPLDKPQTGHGGKTPYEQAKEYDNGLRVSEKARWIILSNFAEIWIYDMDNDRPEPLKLMLEELQSKYHLLEFLIKKEINALTKEMVISLKAGEIVGMLYDAFHEQYRNSDDPEVLKSLNKLCVRIVFCLYGEDAGIFGRRNLFHDYMAQFDAAHARKGLRDLFRILDQKPEERDPYLSDDDPILAEFPYVNGGLFGGEEIEIPPFTNYILSLILQKASDDFDWSGISPTIFGAVFESTLNPETRRAGGMHYTSVENIHKLIDPLFLTDLKAELEEIKKIDVWKTKERKLKEYQNKLASLSFLDPAAGSGNFLTETYLSLRRLENEVLALLMRGQMAFGDENSSPIRVSISQFYGIEINDFAVTVAKTALWIAESQMMKETEDIILMSLDFLPLTTNASIVEGNALRIEWESVVSKNKLNYIMGNPPFVGLALRTDEQQIDMDRVFADNNRAGRLDYVAAWYKKAALFITGTDIDVAFVSTNSIVQGEQVPILWEDLFNNHGIIINFAYRTFAWNSEAKDKAAVHCVIIGFSRNSRKIKYLFDGERPQLVDKINGYLVNADNVFIKLRGKAQAGLPQLVQGNKPWDGGNLVLSAEDREELVKKYPRADMFIKLYIGSYEFINKKVRYCLWLKGVAPNEYRSIPEIMDRLEAVADIRKKTKTVAVQAQAATPMLFSQIRQPDSDYILVPETSSSNRRYIPMGFMNKDVIASNSTLVATNATLFIFGVMTSNVHMAWMRTTCGRLKSDYRYSPSVYNNFPWPNATAEQKDKIEQTAQAILDARALYPESSLADLYDELTMPPELRKAHQDNDRAVMQAYGMSIKETTESSCVAELMRLYQEKIPKL